MSKRNSPRQDHGRVLGLLRHALAADALSSTARRPSLGYSPREKEGIQSMQEGSVRKNLECISNAMPRKSSHTLAGHFQATNMRFPIPERSERLGLERCSGTF